MVVCEIFLWRVEFSSPKVVSMGPNYTILFMTPKKSMDKVKKSKMYCKFRSGLITNMVMMVVDFNF